MKKLLVLLALLIALPLQGQEFVHRYFHYDQIYTDPDNSFKILASTIDGADNKAFFISAGGAENASRGAWIAGYGNEFGGGTGQLTFLGGNIAGGDLSFYTGNSSRRLTIPYLADADDVDLVLGSTATTAPVFTIRGQTIDTDDDGLLCLAAGGLCGNGTRGGYIYIGGEQQASLLGGLTIAAGSVSGSIAFHTGGSQQFYISSSTTAVHEFIFGGNATANQVTTFRNYMADGSDNGILQLTAGGSSTLSGTRGAYIQLEGADTPTAGTGGTVKIAAAETDPIEFYTSQTSTLKWSIASTGNLIQDATNGGNILMTKASTGTQIGTVALTADVTTALTSAPQYYDFAPAAGAGGIALVEAAADALGAPLSFLKSRKVDGTADTIVNASDVLGRIWFYGADGANFIPAAMIQSTVDAAPGATDMPGALSFWTTPDAGAAPTITLKLGQDKAATFAGAINSTATSLGWVIRAAADTACNTTCTAAHGCVFGQNTAALTYAIVDCADAAADICVCTF